MSKEKPEVGDVWETNEHVLYKIIETNERFSMCFIKDSDGYCIYPVLNPYLTRFGKYLGKSKVNLEKLFDVKGGKIMVKAEDIFKCVDYRAIYLTQDKDGGVYFHVEKPVCIDENEEWSQCEKIQSETHIWHSNGMKSLVGNIEVEEFQDKDWTECFIKRELNCKAGQVYFHNRIKKKLIITVVDTEDNLCSWVTEEGKVCGDRCGWILSTCTLLAEYPTWQEAANSKEFNE